MSSYYESAIEAAKFRILAAENWANASAAILEDARSQASSSKKELRDAREYLERLEREREGSHDGTPNGKHASSNADLMPTRSDQAIRRSPKTKKAGGSSVVTCPPTLLELDEENDDPAPKTRSGGSVVVKSDSPSIISSDGAVCSAVEVTDCGLAELNGKYHRFESSDGVPAYSKIDSYDGKEAIFSIGRWMSETGLKKWFITATVPGGSTPKKYAFYVAFAPSFMTQPPKTSWMMIEGNKHFLHPEYEGGRGVQPVPVITHELSVSGSRTKSVYGGERRPRKNRPMMSKMRSLSAPRSTRKLEL